MENPVMNATNRTIEEMIAFLEKTDTTQRMGKG